MAARNKKEIELLLDRIELGGLPALKNGMHIVTMELICPRPMVASKAFSRPYKFEKGALDCGGSPWVKRIFFKESVEYRFGLSVKVSGNVTDAYVAAFFRYFAGALLGIGGDVAEAAAGGLAGDVAAIPFDYAKKKLVSSSSATAPKVVLEGAVDLLPEELEDSMEIAVPLCTLGALYKTEKTGHHGPRSEAPAAARRLVAAAGSEAGKAFVRLNCLG